MTPSPTDILAARRMLENREKGFTFRLFYRRILSTYLLQTLLYAVAIGLLVLVEIWPAVWLCGGMILGAFLRDITWVRSIRKRWPFSVYLTDWEKVQRLAEGTPPEPLP